MYLPTPKLSQLSLFWGLLVCSSLVVSGVAARETPSARRAELRSEARASAWFERHRHRSSALRAFVQRMPKGGDIHSHLSGAVYAERYLKWAAQDGYCVDPSIPALIEPSACGQSSKYFPASELFNRSGSYDGLVDRFSTRNLPFAKQSGHDRFFEAFGDFSVISGDRSRQDDMVAEVANRAASQHTSYLELMLTVQGSEVRQLGKKVGWNRDFAQMRQQLLAGGLMELVAKGSQEFANLEQETAKTMGCGTASAQPGCGVTVRYLQQTTRTKSPVEVFAQFVYAFELAKVEPRVVGINLARQTGIPTPNEALWCGMKGGAIRCS